MWLFLIVVLCFFLLWMWWGAADRYKHVMCRYGTLIRQFHKFECGDATDNLFIKYGGLATIQTVVDSAVTNLLAEESLASVFAVVGTDGHRSGPQLKACLDLQFSSMFGAPFVYPGKTFTRGSIVDARTMKASHQHLTITRDQFNTFVSVLAKTLLDAGVSQTDLDILGPQLNAMVDDIVTVV